MPIFLKLIATLFIMAVSITTYASEPMWEKVRDEEGIKVFLKSSETDDGPIETKVEATISAPPGSILRLITTPEACNQWLYRCVEARSVGEGSLHDHLVYRRVAMPWPVQDRDFVADVTVIEEETGRIIIKLRNRREAYPKQKGAIRGDILLGRYVLVPENDQITELTIYSRIDPKGSIPQRIVNAMIDESPFKTMKGIKEAMK